MPEQTHNLQLLFTERAAAHVHNNNLQVTPDGTALAAMAAAARASLPPHSPVLPSSVLIRHARNRLDGSDIHIPAYTVNPEGQFIQDRTKPDYTIVLTRWTTTEARRRMWGVLRDARHPHDYGAKQAHGNKVKGLVGGGAAFIAGGATTAASDTLSWPEGVTYVSMGVAGIGALTVLYCLISGQTNRPLRIYGRGVPSPITITQREPA